MGSNAPGTSRPLIVGSGVAGPALGIALARAGIETRLVESNAVPRDRAGAFLTVAPNGLKVLEELGLGHRVQMLGFPTDRLVFKNDRGRVLAEVPASGLTVLRGELGRALREAATEAGVSFGFGKRVESVVERDGVVMAAFSDASVEHAPYVLGADGIRSRVRRAIFPDAPAPSYAGVLNLGGVIGTDLPPTGRSMHVIFGRRALFGYAVRATGETYWFGRYQRPEAAAEDEPGAIDPNGFRDELLELHVGDPPEVSRILNAVTDRIGVYPVYDMPPLPSWQSGSVCLVGDAAHALGQHVGQSASLALEDAFTLAKCLRDVAEPPEAFATFERLRRERVERIRQQQHTAEEQARLPSGRLGRVIRDLFLPLALRRGEQAKAWMYRYSVDWNEPVATTEARGMS